MSKTTKSPQLKELEGRVRAYINAVKNLRGVLKIANWDAEDNKIQIGVSELAKVARECELPIKFIPKAIWDDGDTDIKIHVEIAGVRCFCLVDLESVLEYRIFSPDRGVCTEVFQSLLSEGGASVYAEVGFRL